jgi:hypothetical protein
VTLSCTPLSLAEVARRRAALRAEPFSSPSARDIRAERDENEQQDEVMA